MIRIRQQSAREILIELSVQDCMEIREVLQRNPLEHYRGRAQAHASALKLRSLTDVDFVVAEGAEDGLERDGTSVVLRLESETLDELRVKLAGAISRGFFLPSELFVVRGPRGQWLRLYAEIGADR